MEGMNLIVSTLDKNDQDAKELITHLNNTVHDLEIIYANELNLKGCIGCNRCWLVTPGICTIKDDYEQLLIKYLQAKQVIFLTEAKLGFGSYKLKDIIDRGLPLDTMNLKFKNGQMRHYRRYKKHLKMGLIYKGDGNQEFLDKWFYRVMLNLDGESLGTYNMDNKEEITNAFIND